MFSDNTLFYVMKFPDIFIISNILSGKIKSRSIMNVEGINFSMVYKEYFPRTLYYVCVCVCECVLNSDNSTFTQLLSETFTSSHRWPWVEHCKDNRLQLFSFVSSFEFFVLLLFSNKAHLCYKYGVEQEEDYTWYKNCISLWQIYSKHFSF